MARKKKSKATPRGLTRREREIMDVLHRLGPSSVSDVLDSLPDPPSYSAVRALLRILEEKGHVTHEEDGARYLYSPTEARGRALNRAFNNLVTTFFSGSKESAMTALLEMEASKLSDEELDHLASLIDKARKEGR